MKFLWIIVAIPLLLSRNGNAQEPPGLSFFLIHARQNSPAVKENTSNIFIAQLEVARLRSELTGPRVEFMVDYLLAPYFNNSSFIDTDPDPKAIGYDAGITNGGLYSGLLRVTLPLAHGAVLNANLSEQYGQQRQYAYDSARAVNELYRSVTDQYIAVYRDQLLLHSARDLLVLLQDQETVVRELVKAALISRSQQILLTLEREKQEAALADLHNQWRLDRSELNALCGISDTSQTRILPPRLEQAGDQATDSSNFLNKYRADSLTLAASALLFESRYRPVLNVYGDAGLNAVSLDNIQRKFGFSAGVSLRVPLYDGQQRRINDQKNELRKESLDAYRKQKMREIMIRKHQYKEAITGQKKYIRQLQEQESDYNLLLRSYGAEIRTGQVSTLEYLAGIKSYRQLKNDLINARMDLLRHINAYNYWNW